MLHTIHGCERALCFAGEQQIVESVNSSRMSQANGYRVDEKTTKRVVDDNSIEINRITSRILRPARSNDQTSTTGRKQTAFVDSRFEAPLCAG